VIAPALPALTNAFSTPNVETVAANVRGILLM
jgi:hypothetical protein